MGPVIGREVSGSNHLLQEILGGRLPGYPDLHVPVVDVRDVAAAHILAMVTPEASGQRFLLSDGPAIAMKEIGALLRNRLGASADKVPTRTIPSFVIRTAALFSPRFRLIAPDLGYVKRTSNDQARRVLGWQPRESTTAIIDAAESMVAKRLLDE
jgi:nucleoside-diphosphate-sugar epimerase